MKIDKVHEDNRGTIFSITGEFLKENPEVSLFHTKAGIARGGCIHRESCESLCVIEGIIEYVYGVDMKKRTLRKGDCFSILPNTPHYFLSVTDSIVIEWGPKLCEKKEKYEYFREIVNEINKNV